MPEYIKKYIFILTVILLTAGCQPLTDSVPVQKDGKWYGITRGTFRHRWWNYYERGLSFAQGGYYAEALADLQQAATQFDRDQRMARTYGMHFTDYFPHRETGIIFYETGRLSEARDELELSLDQFPSARAQYYLDRVRAAMIRDIAGPQTSPELSFDLPSGEILTRDDPVTLSGRVSDPNFVAAVRIADQPVFMDGSRTEIRFSRNLELDSGRHIVTVAVTNLAGISTERQVVFRVDREGPVISLEQAHFYQNGDCEISGTVHDDSGIARLSVNGNPVFPEKNPMEYTFRKQIPVSGKLFEIIAEDRIGNRTVAEISPPSASEQVAGLLVAGLDSDQHIGYISENRNLPPVILLRDWTDTQTVYVEKIYIAGHVRDADPVRKIFINDTPILSRSGQQVFFNHWISLEPGENRIVIRAEDSSGNLSEKQIRITRNIPAALQLSWRMSLAVFPFEPGGNVVPTALSWHQNLTDALTERNRFRMVERDRLDLILREQQLAKSGIVDRSTALHLGKLVSARTIVTGIILASRQGIEIVGRMVDTETGEILATEDVYDEATDLSSLRALAQAMALKFHMDFPLLTGQVIRCGDGHIFSDLGQGKTALHRRLIVFREEPVTHPVTGKQLGADNRILGQATVTQVLPEMSKADIIDANKDIIRILDRVITE